MLLYEINSKWKSLRVFYGGLTFANFILGPFSPLIVLGDWTNPCSHAINYREPGANFNWCPSWERYISQSAAGARLSWIYNLQFYLLRRANTRELWEMMEMKPCIFRLANKKQAAPERNWLLNASRFIYSALCAHFSALAPNLFPTALYSWSGGREKNCVLTSRINFGKREI